MRKLVTALVGVAAMCGMTAFAQPAPATTTTEPLTQEQQQQHVMTAHRDSAVLHRALMEGRHDPALLPLISKALTDRTTLLNSELAHVTALQALVTALQGGDQAAIKSAREAARTAMETVVANARTLSEDCAAVREAMPRGRRPRNAGATPGTTPE